MEDGLRHDRKEHELETRFDRRVKLEAFDQIVGLYLPDSLFRGGFFADRILFMPPDPSCGADLKGLLQLRTEKDEQIATIYYPAAEGMPTLLYSHGNAEDLGQALELYQAWRAMGFGVLAYER